MISKNAIRLACFGIALVAGSSHAADSDSACQAASVQLLNHLDQGDYNGATADFDSTMKAGLTPQHLSQIWSALQQHFGARGPHEAPELDHQNDIIAVVTPLHYGQTLVDAQVACTADGKITGFYIRPHGGAQPSPDQASPDQPQATGAQP